MSTKSQFNPRDFLPKPIIITTPVGVAVYPKLNEPDTKFDPEGNYNVKLRLSAEEGEKLRAKIEELRDEAREALIPAAEKAGAKGPIIKKMEKNADLPIHETVDDEGNETGELEFTFKMKAAGKTKKGREYTQKPVLVDAKNKPLEAAIWGGSKMEVNAALTAFFVPALGVGVALKLRGVRVIDLVTSGGNRDPNQMFGAPTDGYEGGESDGDSKADDAGGSASEDDDDDL